MNRKINIALIAILAFGAISASAQTADTQTTETGGTAPAGVSAVGTVLQVNKLQQNIIRPITQAQKIQEAARVKALNASTTLIRKEIRDIRGEIKASTTEMRANIKDKVAEKRLEIAKKQAALVLKRLETAIERVQKLSDRVSDRLTKLEAEGVTTTISRGHLAEAKTKLDEATAKIATIKTATDTALASQTPKEEMKKVQGLVKDTAKTIQDAHRHVALAISTVKPGLNKPRPATTTPATTTSATTATTTQ